MPLSLHVFEERYKKMLARCLKEEQHFGVVLIREGGEVGGPAIPESVGTVARIHAVEPLEDGRFNLLTEGTSRFRIQSVDSTAEPYLLATVETVSDDSEVHEEVGALTDETRALFREYFDILMGYAGVDMPGYELSESAEELSFVIAAVVQAEVAERQSFLEMTDTSGRLRRLHRLLTGDVKRMREAVGRTGIVATELPASWRQAFTSRN
jgi:Lon protease-like protein